ncbi:putative signal transducing protein [Pedobacter sp. NJ-S-72]
MDNIVVFEVFYNPIEANIVKSRLMDSGIQCFLSDENTVTINPLYTQALGGVKLHLFERDAGLARSILDETFPISETAKEGEEVGEYVCPQCGSCHVGYVQATKKRFSILTMIVSIVLFVYPFHVKKVYHCFDCLYEY